MPRVPTTFVCDEPIDIEADASIFTGDVPEVNREYTISFSVDQSAFFNTYTYIDSVNEVTIDLTSTGSVHGVNSNLAARTGVNGNGIEATQTRTVGERLVEILAIKLFGNAKARAAIANETEISSHNIFVNDALAAAKQSIFDEYAALDRTDGENNVDGPVEFNFAGDTFQFFLRLSSDVTGTGGQASASYLTPSVPVGSYLVGSTVTQATSVDTTSGRLTNCPITLSVHINDPAAEE